MTVGGRCIVDVSWQRDLISRMLRAANAQNVIKHFPNDLI